MKGLIAVVVVLASFSASAQVGPTPAADDRKQSDVVHDPQEEFDNLPAKRGPSAEPRVIKSGLLAVAEDDRSTYSEFLRQSNTGLVRLLPRWRFEKGKYKPENRVTINGSGAYYSFFYRSHEYGYGSDIELSTVMRGAGSVALPPEYALTVGFAGADYGFLTNLGAVSIDEITKEDARAAFLLSYKPPEDEPSARCEFRTFRKGVVVDGHAYNRTIPIQVGSTYLLRSIVYDRSDLAIAFQVVRQDSEPSVTIAWKLLKQFRAPRLENRTNLQGKCPIK